MDVHLRDLRCFLAVAEVLHSTRAAEALHVSQPALSKQVAALEAQLRTPLFVRDRRGVHLTAAGTALVPAAQAVLAAWEHAEAELTAAATRAAATLTVGISTGLGRGLLPAVRARVSTAAPQAELRVRQVAWHDPTGGLADDGPDRSDAAFVWLPLPQEHRYTWSVVAVEPRLLALPATHRLAVRDAVDIGDLLDEPFLALPAAAGPLRQDWLAAGARGGRPVVIGAEIATAEEAVEALTSGLGVCLVAAGNAPLLTRDGVVTRPVTGVDHARLALAWRRHDERPLLRLLRESVRQVLATG